MNILAVVAHPDDEVLGCGGTLAKHAEHGDYVIAGVLCQRDLVEEFKAATKLLGAYKCHTVDFPDQRLDTEAFSFVVPSVDYWIARHKPDLVYTHWPHDINLDHSLTARAVLTAFRAPHSQATIFAFETLSSTEFGPDAFTPNHWETLTKEQVDRKIRALDCYPSEVKGRPHPRNAEGVMVQARWRGQQVCQPYAEAFQILRSIR